MPPPPKNNKSLFDFFRPVQPAPKPALVAHFLQPKPNPASEVIHQKIPSNTSSKSPSPDEPHSASTLDHRDGTLSLSPPPSSMSEPPLLSLKESVPFRPSPSKPKPQPERVIQNSDDEDDDSGSDLEELSTIFASRSADRAKEAAVHATKSQTPSTPVAKRSQLRKFNFHVSPLPDLTKNRNRIDMKTLIREAKQDEATEASSKRVKAMLAAREKDEDSIPTLTDRNALKTSGRTNEELLESVVAERDDGAADKVKRALRRTEATITEKRWYFFDQHSSPPVRQSFPKASISKDWEADLGVPNTWYHTFVSGFAEDMVGLGKLLPDELFLWILDEICFEPSNSLRNAYLNVLAASSEQSSRLVDPKAIQNLFLNIGAASQTSATVLTSKVKPVQKLSTPYSSRDWTFLLSVIKLLGTIASSMQLPTKMCSICMLLRMSMDKLVVENIDIWDAVQNTISKLCLAIADEDEWTSSCTQICKILFDSTDDASLRVQTTEAIPSSHPRPHDLRRRLAMCYLFNDISYASTHSHSLMSIESFIDRLSSTDFDTNPQTDYRELASLIRILDIALDDGRSTDLDFSQPRLESQFNEDVDRLSTAIKNIMKSIGPVSAAFISKVEAKNIMDLVAKRLETTIRTKRKEVVTWYDDKTKKEEDLVSEQQGMAAFMTKMKAIGASK